MIFPGITLYERDCLGGGPAAPGPPSVLFIICGAWTIPIQGAQSTPAGAEPPNPPPHPHRHSGLCCFKRPRSCHSSGIFSTKLSMVPPAELLGNCTLSEHVGTPVRSVHPTPCRYYNLETACGCMCVFACCRCGAQTKQPHIFTFILYLKYFYFKTS